MLLQVLFEIQGVGSEDIIHQQDEEQNIERLGKKGFSDRSLLLPRRLCIFSENHREQEEHPHCILHEIMRLPVVKDIGGVGAQGKDQQQNRRQNQAGRGGPVSEAVLCQQPEGSQQDQGSQNSDDDPGIGGLGREKRVEEVPVGADDQREEAVIFGKEGIGCPPSCTRLRTQEKMISVTTAERLHW